MYDLIIIGGGPAGLAAAIYASRFALKTLLISQIIGGYMMQTDKICNYPGYSDISGLDLSNNMKKQAKDLGTNIIEDEVVKVKKGLLVNTASNKEFSAKSIILALGTKRRMLNIKGEEEFASKGVSYCATCDAPLFRDRIVAVVGGANSAAHSALLLAKYAKEVHIIYRKDKLRSDPYLVQLIEKQNNIKIHYNLKISEIKGNKMVENILLDNKEEMKISGVFIEIGNTPLTILTKDIGVELDKNKAIIVDKEGKTNIENVYAAGDATTGSNGMRQIVTACAEGALCANSVHHHLQKKHN